MIELSNAEVIAATVVAVQRRLESFGKLKDRMPSSNPWDIDIEGSLAEMAYAKYRNLYWRMGVNTFKESDVGKAQVRGTKHKDGRLIIRENDKDEDYFVLVVGAFSRFEVIGYIKGIDGKKDCYRDNPNNRGVAWWVPQEDLIKFK